MKFETVIRSLIRNRKITLFFVALIIAVGIVSYIAMPKQESPDMETPYAIITTIFAGASQSDVDTYVTLPIEEVLQSLADYKTSASYSTNNVSLVILELENTADYKEVFRELEEKLAALQEELPENCGTIDINTSVMDTAGVLISISSDEMTNQEMTDWAKELQDRLSAIDGFERFDIYGSLDTEIVVRVNETLMQTAGLTLSDIVSLIEYGDLDLPMGNITVDGSSASVDYVGGYDSIEDIEEIELGYSSLLGRMIALSDIADITFETADLNTYYTYNGSQAVILAGYFDNDINVLPLKDEIQQVLDDLESELPESLYIDLIISQPEEISQSLVNFLNNLLIAVGLVILVVLFGMGLRNAIVVSVSLPLSVLMSFAVMYFTGIKIHEISISALILSLGMLVDNSIVVSDSIQNYLDAGKKRTKACILGVKTVALPVFTSTLTTIAAFAPFIFLNSIAGDYIQSLPQIVCIALTASYLSAIFIIPVLGYIFFRPRMGSRGARNHRSFQKLIDVSMRHKALVISVVVVLIAGTTFIALDLDRIFYPPSDKNILYIDVTNNVSDDIESTTEIINQITETVSSEAGVLEYTASMGGGIPKFNDRMYIYTQTPDVGQVLLRVDLSKTDFETNEDFRLYLQERLNALDLDAKVKVKELMYGFPMDEDIKVRIIGDDQDTIKQYQDEIYELMIAMDGMINESKVSIEYVSGYQMEIDSTESLMNGVISAEAQNEISIAMMGRDAAYVNDGEYEYTVVVTGEVETADDALLIPIKTSDDTYIAAGDIMRLTATEVFATIARYEGEYSMVITADYDSDADKTATLKELKEAIENIDMEDVTILYDGEDATIQENFGQIVELGIIALVIVFVILMIQFKSFLTPLIIFITIPLSAIGSVIGLYITDLPVSFTALLGIVSLLGIVVNNAIILIDTIRKQTKDGTDLETACKQASMRRLRPIMLSAITTVIGLIPLVVGNSLLFKPMAVALMSGLLVSTMLTLVVLPVLVSMNKRQQMKKHI